MEERTQIAPDPTTQEKMAAVREAFEKRFGVDSKTRTKQQWKELINAYGLRTVARIEKTDPKSLKRKLKTL